MEVVQRWRDMENRRAGVWASSGNPGWSYRDAKLFSLRTPKEADQSDVVAFKECRGKNEDEERLCQSSCPEMFVGSRVNSSQPCTLLFFVALK